jgi:hypothetical protein
MSDQPLLKEIVYRVVAIHGPLTSIAVADRLEMSRRKATHTLCRLAKAKAIEVASIVPHPEFRGASIKVWKAVNLKPVVRRYNPQKPDKPDVGVDEADLEWMMQARTARQHRQTYNPWGRA